MNVHPSRHAAQALMRAMRALVPTLVLLLLPAAPAWADPGSDATNVAVIGAQRTATVASHATFEAQNAAAIARHGAPEATPTPGPTYTRTATRTPLPSATAAQPTDPPPTETPTPQPCAMQYSWALLLDDQGNAITQLDPATGEVDGLWQDEQGEQMWAPTTYFCADSGNTATPTDVPTNTPTATRAAVRPPAPAAAAPAPAPPPAARPAAPAAAPVLPSVIERVVTATPADVDQVDEAPEPTDTATPSPTSSPTLTPTATATPWPTATPWLTPTLMVLANTDNSDRHAGLTLQVPLWLDPLGRIVGLLLAVLLVLMLQAPVRRGWRALRHGRGPSAGAPGGLADDADVGLLHGGHL